MGSSSPKKDNSSVSSAGNFGSILNQWEKGQEKRSDGRPDKNPAAPDGETYTPFAGLDRNKTAQAQRKSPARNKAAAPAPHGEASRKQEGRSVQNPSSLIGGYDPSDSFADIFESWEKTGNPYSPAIQRKQREKKDKAKKQAPPTPAGSSSAPSPAVPPGGFGNILASWEKKAGPIHNASAFSEKHSEDQQKVVPATHPRGITRSQLRRMLPQAVLDLHGDTAGQAAARVRSFLFDAREKGLVKIAVIHGKGLHATDGEGVLRGVVMDEIKRSRMVSEASVPQARHGGSGVLWIIMKY